jgi:hypothetical protein
MKVEEVSPWGVHFYPQPLQLVSVFSGLSDAALSAFLCEEMLQMPKLLTI